MGGRFMDWILKGLDGVPEWLTFVCAPVMFLLIFLAALPFILIGHLANTVRFITHKEETKC